MGINSTSLFSTTTTIPWTSNWSDDCSQHMHLLVATNDNQSPDPLFIFFAIPATIIILLTVFGNLLVLCFKARVGRTNTTLLVWNLGLTDFLVGVFVLPMGAIHLITRKWIFGRLLCRFWVAADVTFCTCSVVTICIISVDRYLAVTRPLRYKSVVTKCKVISVMVIIWAFSSSILLTTVKWKQSNCLDESICFAGNEIRYLAHSVIFAFFLPASVTLTLYWRIYRLARQRQKALDRGFLMVLGHNMNFLTNTISQSLQLKVAGIYRKTSGASSSNAPITEPDTFQTTLRVHFGKNNGMVEHQRRVLRTHERIAKTLGVVSCSFLFCWLPFFMLYLTNYQCQGCIPPVIIDIASWLGYCNSMLNPIIYSFTVKEFKRSALRAILPLWKALHRILPIFFKAPPEHAGARMSRTGHRAKPRTRSFEHNRTQKGFMPMKMPTRRRQTEPAVFAVTKNHRKGENGIIEEEMERIDEENNYEHEDYEITSERMRTGLGLNTTIVSGTSPVMEPLLEKKNGVTKDSPEVNDGKNWFRRSKKWLCRESSSKKKSSLKDLTSNSVPSLKGIQQDNRKLNGSAIHSSDFPGGISSNSISVCSVGGSAPVSVAAATANGGISINEKPSSGSHCSVKVYCVTSEANV